MIYVVPIGVFKQVFGGLLVSKAPKKGAEEVDAATPPEDGEVGIN